MPHGPAALDVAGDVAHEVVLGPEVVLRHLRVEPEVLVDERLEPRDARACRKRLGVRVKLGLGLSGLSYLGLS